MDYLQVSGIRGYGYTGVLPEEKVLGQWFEVDLKLWLDLSLSGHSDRLEDTLDYRRIIARVQEMLKTTQFDLIERLAEEIAEKILAEPLIQKVEVNLTKTPPIAEFSGQVTVTIMRPQTELS